MFQNKLRFFLKIIAPRFFYLKNLWYISTVIIGHSDLLNSFFMKHSRYPNGYMPKIEYWQYKMNKAIEQGDARGIAFASDKLVYFVGRQYGVPAVKSV